VGCLQSSALRRNVFANEFQIVDSHVRPPFLRWTVRVAVLPPGRSADQARGVPANGSEFCSAVGPGTSEAYRSVLP
jgi:hypothetical protein